MSGEGNASAGDAIAAAFQYCNWCKGFASGVRPVAAVDVGSGPRQPSSSACPRHRELYNLIPLGDEP